MTDNFKYVRCQETDEIFRFKKSGLYAEFLNTEKKWVSAGSRPAGLLFEILDGIPLSEEEVNSLLRDLEAEKLKREADEMAKAMVDNLNRQVKLK